MSNYLPASLVSLPSPSRLGFASDENRTLAQLMQWNNPTIIGHGVDGLIWENVAVEVMCAESAWFLYVHDAGVKRTCENFFIFSFMPPPCDNLKV
jgi:hypothetical protein